MVSNVTTAIDSNAAMITMSGKLEDLMVPVFHREVEKAATQKVKRLVLLMSDLEYISTDGLRALVFAKQRMNVGVEISVIGAQSQVKDALQMSGLDRTVFMLDTYDAAKP